ncbi:MAG: ABC transporter permease [Treponema sp.]|nr:ABC transporter permease [Treponema sp.]
MLALTLFLQTSVQMGTHILLAILGGILCEKVGNSNLGIEGMMLMGAAAGFATALVTNNPYLSMLVAGLAGMAGAAIYGFISITLKGNQTVTGIVLTTFGTGVAGLFNEFLSGKALTESFRNFFAPKAIPLFSKIPLIGPVFFDQSIYVYMSLIFAVLIYVYMYKTRIGLSMRAIGENPAAADSSGIPVTAIKYANVLTGGFLCGLGGAYLSLVFVPSWLENITAGAGWIAVALIIFCTWNPLKAIVAAYLFGALQGLGFKFQGASLLGIKMNSIILDMLPYIATIVVLIFISLQKKKEYQAPAALGNSYFREER